MSYSCLRCNRPLKNKKSQEAGYGPVCLAKKNAELDSNDETIFSEDYRTVFAIPDFTQDIICERTESNENPFLIGKASVNIPQRIKYHSPTGFEWGYSGSGPSDLALNILSCFIGGEEAFKLHQDFKREFIAGMQHEGGTIKNTTIRQWLKAREGVTI